MSDRKALGDLCEVRIGRTPRRDNPAYWGGSAVWVTVAELNGGEILESKEHISDMAVEGVMAEPVPPGTLLFSFKLSIGKMAVAGVPLYTNEAIAALIIKHGDKLDRDFLRYALMARATQEDGANHAVLGLVLNKAKVEALRVPVPTISEQRRIVDLLARAEGIVRLRREAQQKAAELIPAIFIDMFGDPATNPMGWPVDPLGNLLKSGPGNGLYKHKSSYGTGTPILRIDAFYDGVVTALNRLKRVQIENEDELRRFELTAGDIVINRVNSPEYLGKSAIVPPLAERTVFESNMMRFTVDAKRVVPEMVIALLQQPSSRRHFLASAKHAINQSSINQQDVKSLPVILPPLPLQQAFVQRIQSIASIARNQADAQVKASAIFAGLLASAFRAEDAHA